MNTARLDSLPVGGSAHIKEVDIPDLLGRRLGDLGFTPGSLTRCLYAAPSGDPRAYSIRGAVIAVRNRDAHNISIWR